MCGIAGFWDVAHRRRGDGELAVLRRMTFSIRHRGPDDEGCFYDEPAGLALGFRRLSILDLSQEGHQPMASLSGRYVIAFNGEVYNHRRLRAELEKAGFTFRGHSDTEVMLASIEHWGLERAIERFIGMFAFALWDRQAHVLTLVRDRLGIKPLYYGWAGGQFVFASELKAITALAGFNNPIDRDVLCLLLRHSYIPAPYSIYQNIRKLMPGTLLRVDAELAKAPTSAAALAANTTTYWSARDIAESAIFSRRDLPDSEAVGELDSLLRDAVALRMEADVPLGAFLSGGVDSSTVVALMQAQSSRPVQTFSIGFREDTYNEAQHAKAVARHLGTDHTELYVTARDALDVVPQLPAMFDEPFSDSSQIPTYLVSKLARAHVTVSLSGDGGDELFGGYSRYFWGSALRLWMNRLPSFARRTSARWLQSQAAGFGRLLQLSMPLLPARLRVQNPGAKIGALADMLRADSDDARYRLLVSHWSSPESVVLGVSEPPTALSMPPPAPICNPIERMMYFDLVSYLPDDILTKVDRASMAVSLEARVPLLDHRVVEYAWRLPSTMKVRSGQ
ncbi:MAG TPA: asparagine synthase (glutamine-hydrolyzing), partial [Candidatus Saccharimonadales bacterium]|nr:asparagine synthase (glutamine-hydrolyzing) [Candidatus Saccharimonadales bacterium]